MRTKAQILKAFKSGKLTEQEAESALLAVENNQSLSFKVSPKGAVSIYKLRRFPIVLYPNEILRILEAEQALMEFMDENFERLSTQTTPHIRVEIINRMAAHSSLEKKRGKK